MGCALNTRGTRRDRNKVLFTHSAPGMLRNVQSGRQPLPPVVPLTRLRGQLPSSTVSLPSVLDNTRSGNKNYSFTGRAGNKILSTQREKSVAQRTESSNWRDINFKFKRMLTSNIDVETTGQPASQISQIPFLSAHATKAGLEANQATLSCAIRFQATLAGSLSGGLAACLKNFSKAVSQRQQ